MIEKSVMKVGEWKDSVMYRVSCQCTDPSCDMTLELEKDHALKMIYLNLYKDLSLASYWQSDDNWFKDIWLRIKYSFRMMFTGRIEVQEVFIMQEEQIEGFIKALEEGKEYLKNNEEGCAER